MKSAQLLYQYDVRIHLSQRYNQYDRTIRRRRADTHAGDAPHRRRLVPAAPRLPPAARAARSRCPLARVHRHRLTTHERREQRVLLGSGAIGMSHTVVATRSRARRCVGCGSAPAAARSRTREAYLINRSWNAAGVF